MSDSSDYSDLPPFTEAEGEAILRAWKREEAKRRRNALKEAAQILIKRERRKPYG